MLYILFANILGFFFWSVILKKYTVQDQHTPMIEPRVDPAELHNYLRFRPRTPKNISLLAVIPPMSEINE